MRTADTKRTHINIYFILCYLLVITVIIYIILFFWSNDDPYITYRYARNLARGLGFVYNPGEHVLSTTTPLFTILLAIFSTLWPSVPQIAKIISAFSLALGGVYLWDLAHTWKTPVAGWAGLFTYPFFNLLIISMGSETPLYLALCLAAFAYYARRNYKLAAIMSALAILARPDSFIVPALLAAHFLVRVRRPIPWKAVFIFLAPVLVWVIFAWAYFGSPIPTTLATKQHQGAMPIGQRFTDGFFSLCLQYTTSYWNYWFATGLVAIGTLYMFVYSRRWLLFFTWPILYFVAYSLLGVPDYFWYYAPLVPGYVIAHGLGITWIDRVWKKVVTKLLAKRSQQLSTRLRPYLLIGLLITPLLFIELNTFWPLRGHSDPRYPIYRAVGEWIRENTPDSATVGVLELGIIGYFSERTMIDFAGLLQPEISAQLEYNSNYKNSALWTVKNFQLDYLVMHAGWSNELQYGYLAECCELIATFPGRDYNYRKTLYIYSCTDE